MTLARRLVLIVALAFPPFVALPLHTAAQSIDASPASGTSLEPDVTPMDGLHVQIGRATLMLHGNAQVHVFNSLTGPTTPGVHSLNRERSTEIGSLNWLMGELSTRALGGTFGAHAMFSLEPYTLARCGYPLALGVGNFCNDGFVTSHQHPHALFGELAASFTHSITRSVSIQLYGGPSAEPALGPVAFLHRASAGADLFAPASHHWLDVTHTSFGVFTAGIFARHWKLEASAFNGRQPGDSYTGIRLGALDSRSARLWILPSDRWTLQISRGRIVDPEHAVHLGGSGQEVLTTASLTYNHPYDNDGLWATTIAWGNDHDAPQTTNAVLIESARTWGDNTIFVRIEGLVRPDLVTEIGFHPGGTHEFTDFHFDRATSTSLGYRRDVVTARGLGLGLGARVGLDRVGQSQAVNFGTRTPISATIFAQIRPRASRAHGHRHKGME